MLFPFGRWIAFGADHLNGIPLSDEERAEWARSLHGRITDSGWLVLSTVGRLRLGAELHGDVALEFGNIGRRGVIMWPIGCKARHKRAQRVGRRWVDFEGDVGGGQRFGSWCMNEGPMEVHVYADREFIVNLARGLKVRGLNHAYPARRYHIVP